MELLKATGEALLYVIKWVWVAYTSLCDLLGISEWSIVWVTIAVITAIAAPKILKKL